MSEIPGPPPEENTEPLKDEVVAQHLRETTDRLFPHQYPLTFRDRYDHVAPDSLHGKILAFSAENPPEPIKFSAVSSMLYIFRPDGFVINYYNTPEPDTPYTIRFANNSMYGPKQRKWQTHELDFAMEKAMIHMHGINHVQDEFRSQLAGYSAEHNRLVTMGERIDMFENLKNNTNFKKLKRTAQKNWNSSVWDLLEQNPNLARELAIQRIKQRPRYTTFEGTEYTPEQILDEIEKQTPLGTRALTREYYLLDAHESLLKQSNLVL